MRDLSASDPNKLAECPKCAAQQVMPPIDIIDSNGDYGDNRLSAKLDRNPDAWVFKNELRVALTARICGNCGFAELYASQPGELWAAFLDTMKMQKGKRRQ